MNPIKVFIADSDFLSAEGLRFLVKSDSNFELIGLASNNVELYERLELAAPDVLIIDHSSEGFDQEDISKVVTMSVKTKLLAITPFNTSFFYSNSLQLGVKSYLLKNCSREEIIDAIHSTSKGEAFFCNKVLRCISEVNNGFNDATKANKIASCEGISISERENEIIRLIVEGNSNKEIADKLFLSLHTVNTHRKNIMNKLGVNNTAGLVVYAIKNEIISPNKFLFSSSSEN
jgi:DNA-binding NarL/FixJ family response regulator